MYDSVEPSPTGKWNRSEKVVIYRNWGRAADPMNKKVIRNCLLLVLKTVKLSSRRKVQKVLLLIEMAELQ